MSRDDRGDQIRHETFHDGPEGGPDHDADGQVDDVPLSRKVLKSLSILFLSLVAEAVALDRKGPPSIADRAEQRPTRPQDPPCHPGSESIGESGSAGMLQLTYMAPRELQWREVPAPRLPSDDAVLVRPVAVATCDLDALIVEGASPSLPVPARPRVRRRGGRDR